MTQDGGGSHNGDGPPGEMPDDMLRHMCPEVPGYRLIRDLGGGGQAEVYLAEPIASSEVSGRVAVKIFPKWTASSGPSRFDQERRVLRRLHHPNIVRLVDDGETPDGRQFLVTEYIPGVTLSELLKQKDAGGDPAARAGAARLADAESVANLFVEICTAVGEVHQRGVWHRDLKPSNVVIDQEGRPHVLDFGLARTPFDEEWRDEMRTMTTGLVGTYAYMSPEQVRQSENLDPRTDVYSLGVMMYEVLTGGRFPYDVGGPVTETLANIASKPPRPLRGQTGASLDVDERLERIVLHALNKDPNDRYASASELANDLQAYLGGMPIRAGERARGTTAPMRRRGLLVIVGAMVLVAAGVAAMMWPEAERTEEFSGRWRQQRSVLKQTEQLPNRMMVLFGKSGWSSYDLTYEACTDEGVQGTGAVLHAADDENFREFVIGNYKNKGFSLGSWIDRDFDKDVQQYVQGSIELGRWYRMRIEVRADHIKCYVDGKLIAEHRDSRFKRGRIGFSSWGSAVSIRNIRVTSPDGEVMWEGPPVEVLHEP